jgi:hypothetical protein
MWSVVYAKQKNVTSEIAARVQSAGDAWLWVAIDADSKPVASWAIGPPGMPGRLKNRVQLTNDGLKK